MGAIHKFTGDWKEVFTWEGSRTRWIQNDQVSQVSETWLIGKAEGAQNFAVRYYQIAPGGFSRKEQHAYDHGVLVLQGGGEVLIEASTQEISKGDLVYIPPDVLHQFKNTGSGPLGFICVIPAQRKKGGSLVWAEEGIEFD